MHNDNHCQVMEQQNYKEVSDQKLIIEAFDFPGLAEFLFIDEPPWHNYVVEKL